MSDRLEQVSGQRRGWVLREWICLWRELYEHECEWAGAEDTGGGEKNSGDVGWGEGEGGWGLRGAWITVKRREFDILGLGRDTAGFAAILAKIHIMNSTRDVLVDER